MAKKSKPVTTGPRYSVRVVRTVTQCIDVVVAAPDEEQAKELALSIARNPRSSGMFKINDMPCDGWGLHINDGDVEEVSNTTPLTRVQPAVPPPDPVATNEAATTPTARASQYHQIITEATGVTDPSMLEQIEDTMRHVIFHSTLDWQTRDELKDAAKEAVEVLKIVEGTT